MQHPSPRSTARSSKRSSKRGLFARIAACALFGSSGLVASPAAAQTKVAMLLPGSINDQSWNATGYAGLMKMKELGYDVAYSENVPAADHVEAMRDYASRGYKIVIGHSGRFLSAAQRVGPEFPAVQFVAGAGAGSAGGNVMSVNYDDRHFGCQLGVLAARMSKSGKIGGVYALEGLPNMVAQVGAFRICAKQARPDVEVSIIYIKDIEDAGQAKEAAFSLIAGGADVLSGKLNAAHGGLIQAARKGHLHHGALYAHTAIAPDQILTNVVEMAGHVFGRRQRREGGKLLGEFKMYGYDAGDVGRRARALPDRAFNPAVPPAVVTELADYQKKLSTGELKLSPTREDAPGGK